MKKLYWILEDNGDLSNTCTSLDECHMIMAAEFEDMDLEDQEETQYTITPVWYTDAEFANLPEA